MYQIAGPDRDAQSIIAVLATHLIPDQHSIVDILVIRADQSSHQRGSSSTHQPRGLRERY
jgi:hypothetical protein